MKKNSIKPNFFIVGGSKCGTTNISYYMNQHSKIFFSELNEPYYFAKNDVPKKFKRISMITDYNEYLELFKNANGCDFVGEASSVYLACPNAPKLIYETFPDSKILISIRNPIERAHSAYFSYIFNHFNKESFSELIELHLKQIERGEFFIYNILNGGFFTEQIKRYRSIFPSENIKIIIFEEYIKNTTKGINEIFDFLKVDRIEKFNDVSKGSYRIPKNRMTSHLINNKKFRHFAQRIIPTVSRQKLGDRFFLKQTKKPEMSLEDREKLKNIYKNDVIELENYLQINLPWIDFK